MQYFIIYPHSACPAFKNYNIYQKLYVINCCYCEQIVSIYLNEEHIIWQLNI
jgi:hypothetical protein